MPRKCFLLARSLQVVKAADKQPACRLHSNARFHRRRCNESFCTPEIARFAADMRIPALSSKAQPTNTHFLLVVLHCFPWKGVYADEKNSSLCRECKLPELSFDILFYPLDSA